MDYIEIMDTTLRDGEQTTGVSFNDSEKLAIAQLLINELKVNRIEVASARVSEGEMRAVKRITEWAGNQGCLDRIEVLGFVDGTSSLDWVERSGARVVNLLAKGSLRHLEVQLRRSPQQHLSDILICIDEAERRGISINLYLETWSEGMLNSPDYVMFLTDKLINTTVKRIMLPDTLGILNHCQVEKFCRLMVERYPATHFDFHAHNDYDMSASNVFAAVRAGVHGIHTTVNGLGERAGNVPIASVIGILNDHLKRRNTLDETRLDHVSRMVESFSGLRIPANKPLTGENVFTQCCGVHADGDGKGNLYFNELLPERFGRMRRYALGKTSGKANVLRNLEELGIALSHEDLLKVTQRVIELGDLKETVTAEDLPFIIADVLKDDTDNTRVELVNYHLTVARDLRPVASLSVSVDGEIYSGTSEGDGQYDAFMKVLWGIYDRIGKRRPVLTDYSVSIPPGGKTDALVETIITWQIDDRQIRTRGLDADQTKAAIQATMKMLNILVWDEKPEQSKLIETGTLLIR